MTEPEGRVCGHDQRHTGGHVCDGCCREWPEGQRVSISAQVRASSSVQKVGS